MTSLSLFKTFSLLLMYPTKELQELLKNKDLLFSDESIPWNEGYKQWLKNSLKEYAFKDLLDWQEEYVGLFDQNRAHSLHLFEHIHGESRERGQAMIDLMEYYQKNELEISSNELPDYLPLFLEFLSQINQSHALELLKDIVEILKKISSKLKKQNVFYGTILLSLVSMVEDYKEVIDETSDEKIDLDDEWEDKPVLFMNEKGQCV